MIILRLLQMKTVTRFSFALTPKLIRKWTTTLGSNSPQMSTVNLQLTSFLTKLAILVATSFCCIVSILSVVGHRISPIPLQTGLLFAVTI